MKKLFKILGLIFLVFIGLFFLIGIFSTKNVNSDPEMTPKQRKQDSIEYCTNSPRVSESAVFSYLHKNLKDPESMEIIKINTVYNPVGWYETTIRFRAKNSFNGYVIEEYLFSIIPVYPDSHILLNVKKL